MCLLPKRRYALGQLLIENKGDHGTMTGMMGKTMGHHVNQYC